MVNTQAKSKGRQVLVFWKSALRAMCPALDLTVDFNGSLLFLKFLKRGINRPQRKAIGKDCLPCLGEGTEYPVAGHLSIDLSGPLWSRILERPKC